MPRTTQGIALLLVAWLCGPGCASQGEEANAVQWPRAEVDRPFEVSGLVIRNGTAGYLTQVEVLAPETGAFVSCGNIIGGRECATTFPEREYQGYALQIRWMQGGQEWTVGPFVIEIPSSLDTDRLVIGEVMIMGPGNAFARFVNPDRPY